MKRCLVRQPAGLGDILFTQKIVKKIIETNKADIVYWPVSKYYSYLQEYIGSDNIIFVNEELTFPYKDIYTCDPHYIINNDELLYLPLQRADNVIPFDSNSSNHPMYCKYELVGLSYSDWAQYVEIRRNFEREKFLEQSIGNKDSFSLINNTYGTYPDCKKNIKIPHIENSIIIENKGFDRPFDWMNLFKKADNVHTVETSFCYILALLKIKNVNIYSRNTVTDFKYVKNIFPREWNYIT
jgi:hypothetical protein